MSQPLQNLFAASAARHDHLCPRQVLGVRIGLAGAATLGLDIPRRDKRLLAILETDGCFADGIEAATGCTVGHRTLRIEDYGKIAATFVDVRTEAAVRITSRPDVRDKASEYAREAARHYFAQLLAYQHMPDAELLSVKPVCLKIPVGEIVSRAGVRATCVRCGEEIINERWLLIDGLRMCRACAHDGYYTSLEIQAEKRSTQEALEEALAPAMQ
jgi:formylmethanofuran dehydrogenase subunit E